jgi:hypothetical protein
VLLTVRSQYRYRVVRKIFKPSKVPIKIYILSCVHISSNINMSLIQTSRLPPKDQQRPLGEVAPHSLRTSELQTQETNIRALRIPATKRPQTHAVPRGHRPRLNCGDLIIIIIIIIQISRILKPRSKPPSIAKMTMCYRSYRWSFLNGLARHVTT